MYPVRFNTNSIDGEKSALISQIKPGCYFSEHYFSEHYFSEHYSSEQHFLEQHFSDKASDSALDASGRTARAMNCTLIISRSINLSSDGLPGFFVRNREYSQ